MAKKGHNQQTPKKMNNDTALDVVKALEARVAALEQRNKLLENKVEVLESQNAVSSKVTSELTKELDKLSQYTRRSNIIIKNVFLPETETNEDVTKIVNKIIAKDLQLPNVVNSIDKLHRVGKPKEQNGKKDQDVIVRFKSHSARYSVFNARKKTKNYNIRPNLTPSRSKLLHEATEILANVNEVNFAFADIHGDPKILLVNAIDGRFVFSFFTTVELKNLLSKLGFLRDFFVFSS